MLAEIKKKKNKFNPLTVSPAKRYSLSIQSDDATMCCMVRGTTNTGACDILAVSIPLSNIQGASRTAPQRVILCIYVTGICTAF
jgi:hypothetical protein